MAAPPPGPETGIADRHHLFVGGDWVSPRAAQPAFATVTDAGDGGPLARVVQGGADDVDLAVRHAREATDAWSASAVGERADLLDRLAGELERRTPEIAATIAREVGTPLKLAEVLQVGLPVRVLRGYAAAVREMPFEHEIGNSLVHRVPVGAAGAITPWNYPLHQIAAKVGAALAAGCATVLKPSNVAPLSAFLLAEAAQAVGVPAGLLNVVPGSGGEVGEAIAAHPGIGIVTFTGSTRAGSRVAALAAANITRVALELGGKSASIIAEDADLTTAVKASVRNAFTNSGQTCSAWTRLIVPRRLLPQVEEIVEAEVARLVVGHPLAAHTRLGPLASREQQTAVEEYLSIAGSEGLRLLTRGRVEAPDHPHGHYLPPVVYSGVPPTSRLAREEIFGPVLVILTHDGLEDAVATANASEYGLAGAIWAGDPAEAEKWARRMRTGQVDVNGGRFNPSAPFGGFRRSGIGRELGAHGIEEFLELSSIQRP
jgi:aldehyde dehydrogenase (NAD+)